MQKHQYGRGKFDAHPNYVKYMKLIAHHPNYKGMPNAISEDGRINWQVSSGKSTSFYKDYKARWEWWVKKATEVGLPGKSDENERFTIAARLIHPTGYRPCRLCGKQINVGYFYANHTFASRIQKIFPKAKIIKGTAIGNILKDLDAQDKTRARKFILESFPERARFFADHGVTAKAFEKSAHVRSSLLSPGYMGNPPDRLDGFHDYCSVHCRKKSDPGRSDENMRSYNVDRRCFEWWAEGDWHIADALYNKAGPGVCLITGCGKRLKKVSPDHVGPLSCGFKQIPLFVPTCKDHNSSKNRRFTFADVKLLIKHERETGDSVASWQIRAHWDKYKHRIADDNQAKALSNSLRSLQDMYLRVLWELMKVGHIGFLHSLLKTENAFFDVNFVGLDPALLTFDKIVQTPNRSNLRRGRPERIIRIAISALEEYASKSPLSRKLVRADFDSNRTAINDALSRIPQPKDVLYLSMAKAPPGKYLPREAHAIIRNKLQNLFDEIGKDSEIDFTRYV